MRIKITSDGPYLVTGGVPLREMVITPVGHHHELREGRCLPQAESYALCRCGASRNAPFCDGTHAKIGFAGAETAAREPFTERAEEVVVGATLRLWDDGRCAFSRFCHIESGDVWNATREDGDPEARAAAVRAAGECVAGRLAMTDKDGAVLENPARPEIIILQDPEEDVSAGIFVKGPIVVEAADGTEYEVRNRVALCRCGSSENKPFCNANHVVVGYDDGFLGGL